MKKSIEVEYWVIDREGELTTPDSLTELSSHVEGEFVEPLYEIKTEPCETIDELRREFVGRLSVVLDEAHERDLLLVPLGTPIDGGEIDRLPDERSRIQERVIGENFRYTKHCAGTHVHFEQRNVADQLNALIALDPAFALLNTSPYFRGERIADGARSHIYRKRGYEQYPKHGQLWEYTESVGQWERRLERRFEEFTQAAVEAGIAADSVDAHFTPDDVVWTPVRLRSTFPTVEWRSPDAARPSQILALVREMSAIMDRLHDSVVSIQDGKSRDAIEDRVGWMGSDEFVLPSFEDVSSLVDDAIHDGMGSDRLAAYLDRMGFDREQYEPPSRTMTATSVSERDARALRLEHARRLEEDVAALARE